MTHKIKNSIKILAIASLILAVITSGTAFAYSTTWGDSSNRYDQSKLTSGSSATETTCIDQQAPNYYPYLSHDTRYTWSNQFNNQYSQDEYPTVFSYDGFGTWQKQPGSNKVAAYSGPVDVTGWNDVPHSGSGSKMPVHVEQRWGLSQGGNDARSTATQYYSF